ncbi:hypothetical protein MOQ_001040 [Trypanosoma cruzi marinkellei]|uniref:Uncharacterized protein n=1 Tax=Trypanosoma cruzi marinkellei TaxID=85056 RepID=K2NH91_TRYCR|nr:hypothetical protein MOQ_001040 [Trypanosoma cruzi marinkellei]
MNDTPQKKQKNKKKKKKGRCRRVVFFIIISPHEMRAMCSVFSLLRDRLLVAPISPLKAAEVLCSEHPCADSGVTTHLVNCVDGNGILLQLPVLLSLVRCGYRHVSSCEQQKALISQWGPMEETLFSALWIRLRRLTAAGDTTWDETLALHFDVGEGKGWGGCRLEPVDFLLQTLQLVVDVACFVHYSTLSVKTHRLRLLADVFSPVMRKVDVAWCEINEPNSPVVIPPEQLQELGHLAGQCLCLYGKYFLLFHQGLCNMLFAGTSALSTMLQSNKQGVALIKAYTVQDALSTVRVVLVGLLTRTACERQHWIGSMECWMELVLQLAEVFTFQEANWLEHIDEDITRETFNGPYNLHVDVLSTLSTVIAAYHYIVRIKLNSVVNESITKAFDNILKRGLGLLRQLLLLVTGAQKDKALSPCNAIHNHGIGGNYLSLRTWCTCCEAAQVLHACFPLCEKCVTAEESDDAEIRTALLGDALHRLTCSNVGAGEGGGDNDASVSLTFYLTLVRALRRWQAAPNSEECVSLDALWNAARMRLPGSLNASPPPVRLLILLLEELCCILIDNFPTLPKASLQMMRKETIAMRETVHAMWSNCLKHIQGRFEVGKTALVDDDVAAIARGMLYIGAAANCVQKGVVIELFEDHRFLLSRLCALLLPVESGMRCCFGAVRNRQEGGYSGWDAEDDEEDENDYRILISGGAYCFVCETCLGGMLWHKPNDILVESVGVTCQCLLRHHGIADIIAAYVEFFTPVLMQGKKTTCETDPVEEPFAALQSTNWMCMTPSAVACRGVKQCSQDAGDMTPFFTPAALFFIECHQQLLLLPASDVLPSHARRILRVLFTMSPGFFACVPELPRFLLRRILKSPTLFSPAVAAVTENTSIRNEVVREGACDSIESADSSELWEVLLWVCTAKIARLKGRLPNDMNNFEVEKDGSDFLKAASSIRLEEDTEETLRMLYAVDDDSDDMFFTTRQRVLQRALEILQK